MAGLEPVTSAVTGQRSNQLSYTPAKTGTRRLKEVFGSVKFCFGRISGGLKIRAADAKEVGVGNPAEETCCYPNEFNVTFPQLFVNRLSLATIAIHWLINRLISWLYAMTFSNKLNLWSDSNLSPSFAASIPGNCRHCD